jgi:hypothetical protein
MHPETGISMATWKVLYSTVLTQHTRFVKDLGEGYGCGRRLRMYVILRRYIRTVWYMHMLDSMEYGVLQV